ncbi:MAG TPA: prolyl oligopeptidase family serine peptidase [Gemmatimonadaceae bacterium]|nr:prolyl oligopeptidase family serine peptidase [Gemmatimonadaceae bacterium]
MRRTRFRFRRLPVLRATDFLGLLLAVVLVPAGSVAAQQAAVAKPAAASSSASGLKVLNVDDYGRWKRITSADLSADGAWMSYAYAPNDGDDTLFVKGLDNGKLYTVPRGASPKFSDDSRWVGYFISPPEREGRGGRGGARGATPPARGGRGGGGGAEAARAFELLNLATGDKWEAPNAQAFEFSDGARYLAVHLNKASRADTSHSGSDLLLRTLADASTRNIGNVDQYHFDDAGDLLAYTVDAAENLGNGVYLVDPAGGTTRVLDAAAAEFDGLAWSAHGTNLAALRGTTPKDAKQRVNVLLTWTGLGAQGGHQTTYDPATAADFPKGYVLSEFSTPDWSDDGSRVFVGIKAQEEARPENDEPQANVDVWHWKDDEVQSVQIVRLQRELRSTLSGAVLLPQRRFVQLADSDMANVQLVADGRWGVGRNDTTFRGEVAWGGSHADYYAVNTTTGARTLIADTLMRTMGTSPDSKWFLYLKNGHLYAYNFAAAKSTQVDGGMDFVDTDDDHAYERPIWGLAGWSRDGHDVLVYDKYDLWALPLDGSGKPANLTRGVGKAQQIQFRVVRLDLPGGGGFGGFGGGGARVEDHGIDLSQPITLSAYGEWTKKSGYWTLDPGKAPSALIYEDKQVGSASKAEKADRVIFTRQTFREFPDYWVSGTSFASPRQVTDANPFISEYAWGSKVLVDFTNARGQHLQGTLTLPAGYQPGRKYPMLVYFYEILSNTHHTFSMPRYDDRPQMSTYASNGYLVFEPDVRYQIGAPGSSALDCVTSGVKKVIALGYADPAHIGLQGHSWGGYQSSFILTQTSMFAAVVTGAPPTDLISFYDETYPGSGTLQQGITEVGQVRIGKDVTPWNHTRLYEEQSALFNAPKITTPFLILQGTADNAVDWHQGLELYAAARRLGKKVIFLSYPGEPHHLAKKPNQIDFQIRMKQFFDHYLKGAPEPDWMKNGVPQVHKGGPIR